MIGIGIALPLGLNTISAAISALFSAGQQGLRLEPGDLAALYQDSAATMEFTATGQPVGKELDMSGRANHVLQATSTAQPIYTDASGIKFLAFDGVDDGLSTATFTAGTLTSSMDCFIAVKRNTSANVILVYATTAGGTEFGIALAGDTNAPNNQAGTPSYLVNGAAVAPNTRGQFNTAMTVGQWIIVEARNLDLSAWTGLGFGARANGFLLNGSIGGIILCPAQSNATRAQIRTYLGNKVGLAL